MALTLVLVGSTMFTTASTEPGAEAVRTVLASALASPFVSADDLTQQLGSPTEIRTETVANAYKAGQSDTIRHLSYDGLSLSIYEAAETSKSILYHIELTGSGYTSPEGLQIGQSRQDVLNTLGTPTLRAADRLVYAGTDAHPVDLVVSLTKGYITQLAWMVHFE